MSVVLVDSDVLIDVLRARNREIATRWSQLAASDTLILFSPVTAAEIWHGARKHEETEISTLFSSLECVPVSLEIGVKAGEYVRRYGPSHGVELGDALIAATASAHHVPLWTENKKHYPIPEIRFV
jgi:predicted nucleic acid-binding protein